jgi:cyanophycinase-like exopeptidase
VTAPRKTTRDQRTTWRLLVIGGAADPDEHRLHILPHLVKRAGGKKSRILIRRALGQATEEAAPVAARG